MIEWRHRDDSWGKWLILGLETPIFVEIRHELGKLNCLKIFLSASLSNKNFFGATIRTQGSTDWNWIKNWNLRPDRGQQKFSNLGPDQGQTEFENRAVRGFLPPNLGIFNFFTQRWKLVFWKMSWNKGVRVWSTVRLTLESLRLKSYVLSKTFL